MTTVVRDTARDEAKALMSALETSGSESSGGGSREEAQFLMQTAESSSVEFFGADFDRDNFASPALRLSLARGDNLAEKRLRIKKEFAEGEIMVMGESVVLGYDEDTLLFRESPQAQWKLTEPQGFQKSDLWMDVLEALAPSAESIAGEIGLALYAGVVAPPAAPLTIPATIALNALGAVFGETVEQGFQYMNGVQAQTLSEQAIEIAAEGGYSLGGNAIMSPFAATYNVLRGAGALKVGDSGIGVLKAAKNLDKKGLLDKMTPGLVTDNPIIRLQEKQASAVLPAFQRRYNDLLTTLDNVIKSASPGNKAGAMGHVVDSLKNFSDVFLAKINVRGTMLGKAGKQLQEGIAHYSKASKQAVSKLYDEARLIAEPKFGLEPVVASGTSKSSTRQVGGNIVDSSGKPLTTTQDVPASSPFMVLAASLRAGSKGKFSGAINSAVDNFLSIKGAKKLPDGTTLSVTDQLRNVRTELWDLKQVKPGELPTQATGQANDLYKAVDDILRNPLNTNPRFLKAWAAANSAHAIRSTTLGKAAVKAIAKGEELGKLARSYVAPHNSENLLAIRSAVSPKRWKSFQDAAYSEILKDPSKARKVFDSFDQETLDALMPRATQKIFRKTTAELERIASIGAPAMKEMQITNRNFVDSLITSGNPRQTHTLMKAANQTNNKPLRESLRASIVDWVWDGVIEHGGRVMKANEGLLATRMATLKRSELWRMLSPRERALISDAKTLTKAFQSVQDAGTSIQGATIAKGIIPAIMTLDLASNAMTSMFQFGIVSRFYLSNTGRKIMIGGGLQNSNAAVLRALGGAAAQMSAPVDISSYDETN